RRRALGAQDVDVAADGVDAQVGPATVEGAEPAGEPVAAAAHGAVLEVQLPADGVDRVGGGGVGVEADRAGAADGVDLHLVGGFEEVEEDRAAHPVALERCGGPRGGDVAAHRV